MVEDVEIDLNENFDGNKSYFGDENKSVKNFDEKFSENLKVITMNLILNIKNF